MPLEPAVTRGWFWLVFHVADVAGRDTQPSSHLRLRQTLDLPDHLQIPAKPVQNFIRGHGEHPRGLWAIAPLLYLFAEGHQ